MDVRRVLNERIPCSTSKRVERRLPGWQNELEPVDRGEMREEG